MHGLRRTLFIANPTARHGVAREFIDRLPSAVGDSLDWDLVVTEGPGHAAEIAAGACGYEIVAAVGGDGTMHEVVNGIMQHPEGSRPVLGVLPAGSGNDYRRSLGISDDFDTAVRELLDGVVSRVDIGRANGEWFASTASLGLDARVNDVSHRIREETGAAGLWLYLRSLIWVLRHDYRAISIEVARDGRSPERFDALIYALMNAKEYGGGFKVAPDADLRDGLLDVCLIDDIPITEALWRLPFVIFGKHTKMKPIHMSHGRTFSIHADQDVAGQLDGELRIARDWEIELFPGLLRVIVPPHTVA